MEPHHIFTPLDPISSSIVSTGSTYNNRNPKILGLAHPKSRQSHNEVHNRPTSSSAGSSSDVPFPAVPSSKSDRIRHLLTTTAHCAIKDGTLYKCSRCYTKCTIVGTGIEEWLKAPCIRVRPQWMHSSHACAFLEPVYYCQKCGFYARAGGQVSPALASECVKPSVRGKANLAQFAKGKLPKSYKP